MSMALVTPTSPNPLQQTAVGRHGCVRHPSRPLSLSSLGRFGHHAYRHVTSFPVPRVS
jgi:hypothetical protein